MRPAKPNFLLSHLRRDAVNVTCPETLIFPYRGLKFCKQALRGCEAWIKAQDKVIAAIVIRSAIPEV